MLNFLVSLPSRYKVALLIALDCMLLPTAIWGAYTLRLGEWYADARTVLGLSLMLGVLSIPVFTWQGLYHTVTRHIRINGFWLMARAAMWSGLVLAVLTVLHEEIWFIPRSLFFIYGMLLFTLLVTSRAAAALLLGRSDANSSERRKGERRQGDRRRGDRVAIYGAGESGRQLATSLSQGLEYLPVVFLERDPVLKGRTIDSLNVLDPYREDLGAVLTQLGVREILLALPGLNRSQRRSILERLEKLALRVRTVPSIEDILSGKARLDQLEEVTVDDLLGRDAVPALPGLLDRCVQGCTVMVTGAGGSIGSELCRQVLQHGANRLVLLEHSEVALYTIEMELRQILPQDAKGTVLVPVLGSVQDADLVEQLFGEHSIETVYHAAAYKHVPIVEMNPFQGIRNNVQGTMVVANAALRHRTKHFVLISTDKAVRPTNVMGASKRMAELVVQSLASVGSSTVFSMVRFGNVLGSSGSVVPLFRKQIASGGPVTVTHTEVTRYFMTIPEAVQLVIQAGAMATGGEVFVLDMGQPVRIADLAAKMIHLSGRKVRSEAASDGDIEIKVTGLRPGEKLYEELLIGDAVGSTEHPRIMRAEEHFRSFDEVQTALDTLEDAAKRHDTHALTTLLQAWVSGYKSSALPAVGKAAETKVQAMCGHKGAGPACVS